jgi:hypothetical protein
MKTLSVVAMFFLFANHLFAQCTMDIECKGDRICVKGKCIDPPAVQPKPCTKDVDCLGDSTCEKGRCVAAKLPAQQSSGNKQAVVTPMPAPAAGAVQPAQTSAVVPSIDSKFKTIPVRIVSFGEWNTIKFLYRNTWLSIPVPCTLAVPQGNNSWLLDSGLVVLKIKKPSQLTFSKSSSAKRVGGFTCLLVGVVGLSLVTVSANPESGLKLGLIPAMVIGGVSGGLMALGGGMIPKAQADVAAWNDAPRFSLQPSIGVDKLQVCENRSMRFSLGAALLF